MGWNEVDSKEKTKVPYTKFPEGTTKIRVLDKEPYSFWQHWLEKQKTSVTCLGKDCPICNVISQAKANKMTPPYNSTQRHALRIWNYSTNQMEVMIQGRTFMQGLLSLLREVGDITEYDIKIMRSGTGTNTSYTPLPTAPSEFDYEDKVIEEINMEELFKAPTKEEMIQLMQGMSWNEINNVSDEE